MHCLLIDVVDSNWSHRCRSLPFISHHGSHLIMVSVVYIALQLFTSNFCAANPNQPNPSLFATLDHQVLCVGLDLVTVYKDSIRGQEIRNCVKKELEVCKLVFRELVKPTWVCLSIHLHYQGGSHCRASDAQPFSLMDNNQRYPTGGPKMLGQAGNVHLYLLQW